MLELGNQESYSQLYEYVASSIHPEHLGGIFAAASRQRI